MDTNFLMGTIYRLIPDMLIGIGVASYTGSGFWGFAFTVIGLQLVCFLIWLISSLWEWALFIIRDKKIMVAEIEDAFRINNFPAPDEIEFSAENYLGSVATNEAVDPNIRINAAKIVGGLQYPIQTQKFLEAFKLTIAYDIALSNYKKSIESEDATDGPLHEETDERSMREEDVTGENIGPNMLEQWLSQTSEEFLNEQFEYSPVCERCGKGIEGHKVIAVMGRKFADCISNPIHGREEES